VALEVTGDKAEQAEADRLLHGIDEIEEPDAVKKLLVTKVKYAG
jgi:hypothetical protein